MNYYEEEEQYMAEMTNAQMEYEYNCMSVAQAEAEIEQQRLLEKQENEEDTNQ